MSNEIIKDLVEKFSCELILADSQEPKSLSVLLPILKNIHSHCLQLSLKSQAKEIKTARNLINGAIKENPKNISEQIAVLETLIATFSASFQNSEQDEQALVTIEKNSIENETDPILDCFEQLEKKLGEFKLMIAGFCPGEIMDLGAMLNSLDGLIEISKELTHQPFIKFPFPVSGM